MNKELRMCIPVKKDNTVAYHIHLEDSFARLGACLQELGTTKRKICIVTDEQVAALYGAEVEALVKTVSKAVSIFTFPAGEANKTLDTVKDLYTHLIQGGYDRTDMLLALGGGVVGDLTGYTAATYLRGISFVQVPTTLLSQVDSSIGGKTGVDFDQYKNMVGAFHQPALVYMNIGSLKTLTPEQFSCGMGEILKHGLIKDAGYYEWAITHIDEIEARDIAALKEMIARSCEIKRAVVELDPMEQGERALLNFGHTIGHAIEKCMEFKLLHGQCVALGSVAAAYISHQRGLLDEEELYEIRDMNVGFGLPISFHGVTSEAVVRATKSDKKMESGSIKFILLQEIGRAFIDKTVTDEEMLSAVQFLMTESLEGKME